MLTVKLLILFLTRTNLIKSYVFPLLSDYPQVPINNHTNFITDETVEVNEDETIWVINDAKTKDEVHRI